MGVGFLEIFLSTERLYCIDSHVRVRPGGVCLCVRRLCLEIKRIRYTHTKYVYACLFKFRIVISTT